MRTLQFLALCLAGFLFAGCPSRVPAQVVTLLWDDNTETNVIGYRVYHGNVSRQYSRVTDVGDITFAEIAVTGATYFAVTAYDSAGLESGYSDEVSYVPPSGNTLFISGIQPVLLTNVVPVVEPPGVVPRPGYYISIHERESLGGPITSLTIFVGQGEKRFYDASSVFGLGVAKEFAVLEAGVARRGEVSEVQAKAAVPKLLSPFAPFAPSRALSAPAPGSKQGKR